MSKFMKHKELVLPHLHASNKMFSARYVVTCPLQVGQMHLSLPGTHSLKKTNGQRGRKTN